MASSIMGIGTSGLLAAQRQLATTSHNISNVNTDGYARQRAEQAARLPQFSGNGYIGTGVSVETTVRLANEFLEEQIRESNSQYGKYDAFHGLSTQIDNILANPDSGLTPTIESFFSALQEANDNPSSTPARQVLLTEAETMTERFKLLDDRFIQLNNQVNQQLVDLTQEITDAARSVAQLNVAIVKRIGAGQGNMPNDLIDQREVLIKQIAENIDVSVIYQDDGAANLFVGSGQSLVVGGGSATISTRPNAYNAEDLDVILTQGTGSVNITNSVTGGELEGVLSFKTDVLELSRRSLGRIAIAMTEEVNTQHKLGMTLQNTGTDFNPDFNMGGDFFTDLSGPILGLPAQNSSGEVSINITDSRVLTTSNYQLDYDGGAYTLTRLSDNKTFTEATLTGLNNLIDATLPGYDESDPQAEPQGFSFSTVAPIPPATAPLVDDSYLIRPTFEGSADIDLKINNVLDIALASPIVSGAVTDATSGAALNSGNGEISLPLEYKIESGETFSMVNTTVPDGVLTMIPPSPPITLTYDAGLERFTVNNLGAATIDYLALGAIPPSWVTGATPPLPYDPQTDSGTTYIVNYPIGVDDVDSFAFQMQSAPNNNDSFEIGVNQAPYDDNRNGLLMAKLQTAKTLENNSSDFQAGYAMIVSDVGTKTHSAEIDLLAQQTLSEQAKATRESYSGVNLDEEAADLLKFQQAYQASARVVSSADEMFQTLLAAVG